MRLLIYWVSATIVGTLLAFLVVFGLYFLGIRSSILSFVIGAFFGGVTPLLGLESRRVRRFVGYNW
jgi:hypothetical protein